MVNWWKKTAPKFVFCPIFGRRWHPKKNKKKAWNHIKQSMKTHDFQVHENPWFEGMFQKPNLQFLHLQDLHVIPSPPAVQKFKET